MCTPPTRRSPYSQQKAALNSKVSQILVFGPAPIFFLHRTSTSTSVASFGFSAATKARRNPPKNYMCKIRKGNMFSGFYFLLSSGSFMHCYCAAIFSILLADETMGGIRIVLLCHCCWIFLIYSHACGKWCWRFLVVIFLAWFGHFHVVIGRCMNINGHSVEGRRWGTFWKARLLGRHWHIGPWWIFQQIRLKRCGVLLTSCTGCGCSRKLSWIYKMPVVRRMGCLCSNIGN